MVHGGIKGKRKLVTSLHSDSLSTVTDAAANIAPQILGCEVRDGTILQPCRVCVAANVLPRCKLGGTDRELLKDVMPCDGTHCQSGHREA